MSHTGLLPCYIFCTEPGSQSLSAECTKYQVKQLGFGARRAPKLLVEYNSFLQLHYWTKVLEIKIWVNDSGPHSSGEAIQNLETFAEHSISTPKILKASSSPLCDDDDILIRAVTIQSWKASAQTQFPWAAKSQSAIVKNDHIGQDCDRSTMFKSICNNCDIITLQSSGNYCLEKLATQAKKKKDAKRQMSEAGYVNL